MVKGVSWVVDNVRARLEWNLTEWQRVQPWTIDFSPPPDDDSRTLLSMHSSMRHHILTLEYRVCYSHKEIFDNRLRQPNWEIHVPVGEFIQNVLQLNCVPPVCYRGTVVCPNNKEVPDLNLN